MGTSGAPPGPPCERPNPAGDGQTRNPYRRAEADGADYGAAEEVLGAAVLVQSWGCGRAATGSSALTSARTVPADPLEDAAPPRPTVDFSLAERGESHLQAKVTPGPRHESHGPPTGARGGAGEPPHACPELSGGDGRQERPALGDTGDETGVVGPAGATGGPSGAGAAAKPEGAPAAGAGAQGPADAPTSPALMNDRMSLTSWGAHMVQLEGRKKPTAAAVLLDEKFLKETCEALGATEAETLAWAREAGCDLEEPPFLETAECQAMLRVGAKRGGVGRGSRRFIGMIYRKGIGKWCMQLWYRRRTHTLPITFDDPAVCARARDRLILHIRGHEECVDKHYLNFPREAPRHLEALAAIVARGGLPPPPPEDPAPEELQAVALHVLQQEQQGLNTVTKAMIKRREEQLALARQSRADKERSQRELKGAKRPSLQRRRSADAARKRSARAVSREREGRPRDGSGSAAGGAPGQPGKRPDDQQSNVGVLADGDLAQMDLTRAPPLSGRWSLEGTPGRRGLATSLPHLPGILPHYPAAPPPAGYWGLAPVSAPHWPPGTSRPAPEAGATTVPREPLTSPAPRPAPLQVAPDVTFGHAIMAGMAAGPFSPGAFLPQGMVAPMWPGGAPAGAAPPREAFFPHQAQWRGGWGAWPGAPAPLVSGARGPPAAWPDPTPPQRRREQNSMDGNPDIDEPAPHARVGRAVSQWEPILPSEHRNVSGTP